MLSSTQTQKWTTAEAKNLGLTTPFQPHSVRTSVHVCFIQEQVTGQWYDPLFCYKRKPWRLFKETLSSGLMVQLTQVSSEHTCVICNSVMGPKSLKNTVPTTANGEGTGARPTVRHRPFCIRTVWVWLKHSYRVPLLRGLMQWELGRSWRVYTTAQYKGNPPQLIQRAHLNPTGQNWGS